MSTGRYFYIDQKTGRKFCIEPISTRTTKQNDNAFGVGGMDDVKGGSITEEDSIITEANGYRNIMYIPAGKSPDSVIEELLKD